MTLDHAPVQPQGFAPQIAVSDPHAAAWLAECTLRLRREVAWLWHERGTLHGIDGAGSLPPLIDPLHASLDLNRYENDRHMFFASDPTARYLTDQIEAIDRPGQSHMRGGFGWLMTELNLTPVECFTLALALGGAVDSARGTVIAACQNAPNAQQPTLALAQRLWDSPGDVLGLMDPGHPLYELGILDRVSDWESPLQISPQVARQLLFPDAPAPAALTLVLPPKPALEIDTIPLAVARVKTRSVSHQCIMPITGPIDGPHAAVAAQIADADNLPLVALKGGGILGPLLVVAWLRGTAVLLPYARVLNSDGQLDIPYPHLPVVCFIALADTDKLTPFNRHDIMRKVTLPALDFAGREAAWRAALPEVWASEQGRAVLSECARRFAFEAPAINRTAAAVHALDRTIDRDALFSACRADLDLGDLAKPVQPRFRLNELMLPKRQARQINDLVTALRVLGQVHMEWGTGRAWNEGGLSVLFTGPPGTGKTMAAEAIATEIGMPMYRIDLSQVVSKYIGETEKNLSRLFDAADSGDAILFFDEADAVFGKRTEIKDAHDRYSNHEVSYLLERMERFKGMAVLASNRKKDLDEAFLRRLRTIVTFPLPEAAERLRIWQAMMPKGVDCTGLDLKFLADRLPLSGGHIRSAVFNACLQSVRSDEPAALRMPEVVRAVKDEFDKLGRTVSLDQFGPYAAEVRDG